MPHLPTLNYKSRREPMSFHTKARWWTTAVTGLLFGPALLVVMSAFVVNPVGRGWMNGVQFNHWVDVAWGCAIAGFVLASVAVGLGNFWAAALAILHATCFYLAPAFYYASGIF